MKSVTETLTGRVTCRRHERQRLTDKRLEQTGFANLTDYSQKCPEGFRSWFCFIRYEDGSENLLSNIFAKNRLAANAIVFSRFADCLPHMAGWSLQEAF